MTESTSLPGEGNEAGSSGRELSRDLGFPAVFATATGTMIGAGIFILPGVAAANAGPGAALSFLFAGLITSVAALSVSELATAMPKAGGDYYFVSRATGPLIGTMVGVGAWLALVLKGSFALVGLGQYVLHFSPVPILATAVAGGIGLTLINVVGAKASGALQNLIVAALLLIMGVFAVVGLGSVQRATLDPALPFGWSGVFATTGLVFISYLGVMKSAAISEEVKDPGRNLPRGILTSVVVVTTLYVLTMVIVTGVLPFAEVVDAPAPLADAAGVFLGAAGALVVAVAGLLATLSTGNAALLSSSRYPFAMARDGLMTDWISRIHPRFRTPSRSILVTGAVMTGLALALDVEGLAKLGGAFGLIVFALANVSVVILRRAAPAWYRPDFRMPGYPILPLLGAVASVALLPGMGWLSLLSALCLAGLATGWYFWRKRAVEAKGERLQPEYGLGDRLQELRQVQSLEEKQAVLGDAIAAVVGAAPEPSAPPQVRIVVEVPPNEPYRQILTLGAAFGRRYQAPMDILSVTEVPYQAPLDSETDDLDPGWVEELRARMTEQGVPHRFHNLRARDRARAILAFTTPDVRIVLLDWREEFRRARLLGSHVDAVLRDSPTRVAVLKYRGSPEFRKILVATAGSPYATIEVELADAVASFTGATLTFMMVLPPAASEVRETQARAYLKKLNDLTTNDARLLLVRGEDVAEEILRAGEDQDLIVLGASREVNIRTMFGTFVVGEIADEVAERAKGSVLLARDARPSRRWWRRLARWVDRQYRRLRGRPVGRFPRIPDDVTELPTIEPFPRGEERG